MFKNWVYNILLGLGAMALIGWLIFVWISWYTHHNKAIEVPNMLGMEFEKAAEQLEDAGLRYEITDSVYNPEKRKNAITEQDPEPGFKVKPNRIIYLIVNSRNTPKIKMPGLVDRSYTLARAVLKSSGLIIGNVEFTYNETANNLVVKQLYKGRDIKAGDLIEKGSTVDLVVSTSRQAGGDSNEPSDSTALNSADPTEKKPEATATPPKKKKRRRTTSN